MKCDDHERTNAASGCASNDGEEILAAVREQHRTGKIPARATAIVKHRWSRKHRWSNMEEYWTFDDEGRQ